MRERDVLFGASIIMLLMFPVVGATGGLEFEDLEVAVEGNWLHDIDTDGGTITARAGEVLDIFLEVENIYTRDQNIDVEHVRTSFTIDELDAETGVADVKRRIDIDAGDEVEIEGRIIIPDNALPGTYFLEIKLHGEDTQDRDVTLRRMMKVIIESAEHDVHVVSITAPQQSKCIAPIVVELENSGKHTEKVALSVRLMDKILKRESMFIQSQQTTTVSYDIKLPQGVEFVSPLAVDIVYDNQQRSAYAYIEVSCARDTEGGGRQLMPSHTQQTYLTPIVEIHQQAVPDASVSGAVFPFSFLIVAVLGVALLNAIVARLL